MIYENITLAKLAMELLTDKVMELEAQFGAEVFYNDSCEEMQYTCDYYDESHQVKKLYH